MTTRYTAATLRREFPGSRFPVAREIADIGNVLQSARLLRLADKVKGLEADAGALEASLTTTLGDVAKEQYLGGPREEHSHHCPGCYDARQCLTLACREALRSPCSGCRQMQNEG